MSAALPEAWPWLALALLGAYHGLNPAMGWLFAVALGLQEKRRSAVLRALVPIALGHEASVGLVVVLAGGAQLIGAPFAVRLAGAAALVIFGTYKILKPRAHPRWVGMRVSLPELSLWSFLMSTAHGAGLMLFPLLLGLPPASSDAAQHSVGSHAGAIFANGVAAILVHTAGMLALMALISVVVYERLGVAILRRAWVNLDLIWALALILAGILTLFT